jgi:hypothetical protein
MLYDERCKLAITVNLPKKDIVEYLKGCGLELASVALFEQALEKPEVQEHLAKELVHCFQLLNDEMMDEDNEEQKAVFGNAVQDASPVE